jgi:hypothetical protein
MIQGGGIIGTGSNPEHLTDFRKKAELFRNNSHVQE